MSLPVVELLTNLVSIPSVNPMGNPVADDIHGEGRLARFVSEYLAGVGIQPRTVPGTDGRDSVYAVLDAGRANTVLLEAHMDTVAPNPKQKDPFAPRVEGGRLYGRGACDTKGPMAAMLTALAGIIESGAKPAVNVIFAAAVDEEYGMAGSRSLAKELEGRADFALIGEPTGMWAAISHKGVIRWGVTVKGKAAHAATPHLGENAIYRAARLVGAVEDLAGRLEFGASHPILGPGTVCIGTIRGGSGVNTVPQECAFTVDRRYLPNETIEEVENGLVSALSGVCPQDQWELERLPSDCPPLDTPADLPSVRSLQAALSAEGLEPGTTWLPYATDAAMFARHGIPGVVIGPGDGADAHTVNESIDLAEVEKAVRVFRRFLVEAALE